LYCDVCGEEIPEASKDEGWDTGTLILKVTPYGDNLIIHDYFDFDILCDSCVEAIKEALEQILKEISSK